MLIVSLQIKNLLNNCVQVAQTAVSDLISSPLGLAAHVEDPDDIIDHLVEDLKESLLAG